MPEDDSVYKSGEVYTSSSERAGSPARDAIPLRLRNPPPVPSDDERTAHSAAGDKLSPQGRKKLPEPPTVKRAVSDIQPKPAIVPPAGKKSNTLNAGQTAPSDATVENNRNKIVTVASGKGQGKSCIFFLPPKKERLCHITTAPML